MVFMSDKAVKAQGVIAEAVRVAAFCAQDERGEAVLAYAVLELREDGITEVVHDCTPLVKEIAV
jgi:hypothetical protein